MRLRFLRRATRKIQARFEFNRPNFKVALCNFAHDGEAGHWSVNLFFVWVRLWAARKPPRDPDGILDSWGFAWFPFGAERYLLLTWGTWRKFVHMPWAGVWVRTERLDDSGALVETAKRGRDGARAEIVLARPMIQRAYRFRYVTKYGEAQESICLVTKIERLTWQWRFFVWLGLPLGRSSRTYADVRFTEPMGSERGTWKGGVIGTAFAYVPGESIDAAYHRFQNRANLTKQFCR